MPIKEDILNWWKQARQDFDTAKDNFKIKRYEYSSFLCQQAIEKALKALYIKKFKNLKKTHDLVLLSKELKLPDEIIEICKEISPAYTYTRYPDVVKIENIDKVSEKFIIYTEKVMSWIEKNLF